MRTLITVLAVGAILAPLIWWASASIFERDLWSISIYAANGPDPCRLVPHPAVPGHPVLTAAQVTDVRASFVADPFMIRHGETWYMFLEVMNAARRRGEIAVAASRDGLAWRYEGVVLREPFHLSYPYVFPHGGEWLMIPETRRAHAVRLYRAESFPREWRLLCELLAGDYGDPSIVHWAGRWWLFALHDRRELTLHHAPEPHGPWTEHPASPIVTDRAGAIRPGGRVIEYGNGLLRFSQDRNGGYGSALRAFVIDELSTMRYREHEAAPQPILSASRTGWNRDGMHHVDLHRVEGGWLACVDGKRRVKAFSGRRGARHILNTAVALLGHRGPARLRASRKE